MTKNSLENFWSKYLFDKEQKTRFFISYCISALYKNLSKLAKIGAEDSLLDKNGFSEPVYCQKSQQTWNYENTKDTKLLHKTKAMVYVTSRLYTLY